MIDGWQEYLRTLVEGALHNNEFFAGGLLLGALGFLAVFARKLPGIALRALERRFLVSVELRRDESRYRFAYWMAAQGHTRKIRRLLPRTRDRDTGPEIEFGPGYGRHFLRHGGTIYVVNRRLEKPEGGGGGGGLADLLTEEVVTVSTLSRSTNGIKALIAEASEFAFRELETRQRTLVFSKEGFWSTIGQDIRRDLDSVVLPPGFRDEVVRDAELFFGRREWYASRGVPWRRGYLLHGPPGTGKTSLVRALATHFALRLYVLNLTDEETTDRGIGSAFSEVNLRSIVLLEDVDALLDGRKVRDGLKWTFAGLINAIDGALSGEGRLLIVTSNRPGVLDQAFLRPGRVDRRYLLGYACAEQAAELFLRFFPGEERRARAFGEEVARRGTLPVAALQGHLLNYGESAAEALEAAGEIEAGDGPALALAAGGGR